MSAKTPCSQAPVTDWRSDCPLACALDVLGDKWTLLIVRDLFIYGPRTYTEFCNSPENISTNILASRLKHLVQLKIINRVDPVASSRGNAYELTDSGLALKPVLMAYVAWANSNLTEFNDHMVR